MWFCDMKKYWMFGFVSWRITGYFVLCHEEMLDIWSCVLKKYSIFGFVSWRNARYLVLCHEDMLVLYMKKYWIFVFVACRNIGYLVLWHEEILDIWSCDMKKFRICHIHYWLFQCVCFFYVIDCIHVHSGEASNEIYCVLLQSVMLHPKIRNGGSSSVW